VTDIGKQAVNAEKAQEWELAFECYQKALKLFIHLIKCKLIGFIISNSITFYR